MKPGRMRDAGISARTAEGVGSSRNGQGTQAMAVMAHDGSRLTWGGKKSYRRGESNPGLVQIARWQAPMNTTSPQRFHGSEGYSVKHNVDILSRLSFVTRFVHASIERPAVSIEGLNQA
jgi:hypothetical protein